MRNYFVTILFSIVSANTYALGLRTGTDVLIACQTTKDVLAGKSSDSKGAEACIHFLMGFDSGQTIPSLLVEQPEIYCQPDGTNIGKMVTSVVDGIQGDSSYHNAPAGVAVWKALATAWPCE